LCLTLEVLLEDIPVPDLVGLDVLDSLCRLGHGEDGVDDGLDTLLSGEFEHVVAVLISSATLFRWPSPRHPSDQTGGKKESTLTPPSWNQGARRQWQTR
jgi:hypothetical protein